jgi:hypothetical protein
MNTMKSVMSEQQHGCRQVGRRRQLDATETEINTSNKIDDDTADDGNDGNSAAAQTWPPLASTVAPPRVSVSNRCIQSAHRL